MTTAVIRGNEGTDFCLVIVAQCLVCWFSGHYTWVRLQTEVRLSHSLLIALAWYVDNLIPNLFVLNQVSKVKWLVDNVASSKNDLGGI